MSSRNTSSGNADVIPPPAPNPLEEVLETDYRFCRICGKKFKQRGPFFIRAPRGSWGFSQKIWVRYCPEHLLENQYTILYGEISKQLSNEDIVPSWVLKLIKSKR